MKVFVIDPANLDIYEAEYNGSIDEIYQLGDFDCFDVASFNAENDGVYVDDNGLFKEDQSFFAITGYPQPLAGKGVVIGCDEEGASVEPSVSLEWLHQNVKFVRVV